MTSNDQTGTPQKIKLRKVILPVVIGISVSVYLIAANFKPAALASVHFSSKLLTGLILAAVAIVARDFSFMYKLRLSVGEKLKWIRTLRVVLLWEFGTAIGIGTFAGIALAFYALKKEGMSYGKSTAAIMLAEFLDNLAFVVMFTILYLVIGKQMLIISAPCPDLAGHEVMQGIRQLADKAWIGYLVLLAIAIFFGSALFIIPHTTRKVFHWLATLTVLSRFKTSLEHLGTEIEITAREFKGRGILFWIKMIAATLVNWASRYLVACALLYAFSDISLNLLEVFARQYVQWLFLAIPSTPGRSGVAEMTFIALNCEYMPVGLSAAIALVWRMYSYYLYLILGMIVLPKFAAEKHPS